MVADIVAQLGADMAGYIDAYMLHLDDMLKAHEGHWTVFVGSEPLGFYQTEQKALEAVYSNFGTVDCLVRQVSQTYKTHGPLGEPVEFPSLLEP